MAASAGRKEIRVDTRVPEDHDTFRDALASVGRDGRRRWMYTARTVVGACLLAFLFLAPFLTIGGQPLMLLDVLERRFVLLGVVFRPQDFSVVVLIALAVLVTLVLSTVLVGRVWCGWLCPQTVFMELLFRRLEFLVEGSAERQLRRDRGPWTADRVLRKGLKHAIFFGLSFVIANVFLAWIIGAEKLRVIVTDPPGRHLAGLAAITLFSAVFYAVFARFREQACVLACPYGRMMSALIDSRTVTVTYDGPRGEPRGRLVPHAGRDGRSQGDCIDCHQCVTVCPTGIDIRDGIQLECVNCTACIDACNRVMARVGRPPGLIRLTSHEAVARGERRWLTPRVAAYGSVWLGLVAAVILVLVLRRDLDVVILRQPGTLYATAGAGEIANFYSLQALNRTSRTTPFAIEVVEPGGAIVTVLGHPGEVEPYGLFEGRLLLRIPTDSLAGASTPVRFAVRTGHGVVQTIDSAFLGPAMAGRGGP
jgi:cytochrome c oxidase accessory protein FixG